jgi:uncharacterized protein (TIGR03663 family)
VDTGSTRSLKNKQREDREKAEAAKRAAWPARAVTTPVEISPRTWLILSVAILFVAAVLRLYDLDLVPLHHDEGVNGNFLVRLVREGQYNYDPANYHGPTLYYFAAFFPWLLRLLFGPDAQNNHGLTTVAIRCVPAFFGIATVALIFTLRRNLGAIATLAAAFLLAVSPGAVYLSRYFIHETLFVFFTLGIVVAALKYYEDPQPIYLILGAVSAALLFATKETAVISAGVLLIALALTIVCRELWNRATSSSGSEVRKKPPGGRARVDVGVDESSFLERVGFGGPIRLVVWLGIAGGVFWLVYLLFYSSFSKNPQGIIDSIKAFQFWSKTGKEAHVHPPLTYFHWLLLQESPLLILGAMGALLAVLRPAKSFALFVALWAFGLIAGYSRIDYKTPWLALNFIVPLALTSGITIQWFYEELGKRAVDGRMRVLALAGILLFAIGPLPGLAQPLDQILANYWERGLVGAMREVKVRGKTFIPGYQTLDLNFLNYDNDDRYYVYVYAHTRRQTLKLVDEINRLAQRTRQGGDTGMTIVSPDYWPLPWYLRNYKRVGYYGRMSASVEPIIIASQAQAAEMQTTFGDRYVQIPSGENPAGSFALRPGVELLLYARRELVR